MSHRSASIDRTARLRPLPANLFPAWTMTRYVLVVLVALSLSVASAQTWEPDRPRALDYLAESGGALAGGALIGAGAGAAIWLFDFIGGLNINVGQAIGAQVTSPFAAAALAYPAGCAWGSTFVGEALKVEGNTGLGYGGAYVGLGLGLIAGLATGRTAVGLVGAGVLAPAGAVIGYNIGARPEETSPSFGARLSRPTVAFRFGSGPDGQARTVVDCRLVTMRL